jgi:NADPH2:quinone reductase
MKAVRIHEFGSTAELLRYEEVPIPEPGPDEILIKIEAASLNRGDLALRNGAYRIAPGELPVIPGREFAGTVAQLGAEVHELELGQRGDGMAAIQIAKHLGAKVISTSSSNEKCQRLRQLGADEAIDYTKQNLFMEIMRITTPEGRDRYQERQNPDVMEGVNVLRGLGIDPAARRRPFPPYRGVDVVLEMIGGDIYQKSLQVLAPGGRLVSLGGAFGPVPDPPPSLAEGRKANRFSITNHLKAKPEDFGELANLLQLIKEKQFQVIIDRSFPLAEARAAQRHLEGRGHFGKVVLKMD